MDTINYFSHYHQSHDTCMVNRKDAKRFINSTFELMFPQAGSKHLKEIQDVQAQFDMIRFNLDQILKPVAGRIDHPTRDIIASFFKRLPIIHQLLIEDAESIFQGDPAATSVEEVIATYPGFYAIAIYRIAHFFHGLNVPVFPRLLTEIAHGKTGIDIHPGAQVGHHFCIDHGTGIVIGETTKIGNYVKIYQGVTLGALSVDKELTATKRHPTIEDHVVIYSGATILGGETVIGEQSVIGGNVWLTTSVSPHSIVYHQSEVHVRNTKDADAINFVI